jgi:hypothetical protein
MPAGTAVLISTREQRQHQRQDQRTSPISSAFGRWYSSDRPRIALEQVAHPRFGRWTTSGSSVSVLAAQRLRLLGADRREPEASVAV